MRFVLQKKGGERGMTFDVRYCKSTINFVIVFTERKIYIYDDCFFTGYYFHEFIVFAQIAKIKPFPK